MSRFILPLLAWTVVLANPVAQAAPALRMIDRVRSMSLASDGNTYDVTFAEHAAYYRVGARTSAARCLLRAMRDRQPVAVTGDAATLVMGGCRPAATAEY